MNSLKGSKTEKNLLASFAGESQARNRYTYFASQAKKEGYEQIAAIFLDTSENEKEHAKRFFKFLEGGDVEITATYPAGIIGSTLDNLKASANGENYEHTTLYPGFANIAEEEGFTDIACAYRYISTAEKWHEKRYLDLYENIKNNSVFSKKELTAFRCRNCGYVHNNGHNGKEAPEKCPACLHTKSYFEVFCECY